MENFDIATEASATALDSENSALIENAKALDSVSGKWQLFKAGINNTKLSLLDDNVLKDLLDVGIAITDITQVLGGFNVVMATLMTFGAKKIGLFNFITEAKTSKQVFQNIGEAFVGIKNSTKAAFEGLSKMTLGFKGAGASATATKTATAAANVTFGQTKVAASMAAAGVQLFKAAMSFGLALLISFVIEKLVSLIANLINAKDELKEFNSEAVETAQMDTGTIVKAESLKGKIEESQAQLDDENFKGDRTQVQAQMVDYQKEMASLLKMTTTGYTEEGEAIAENTDLMLEQIEVMKTKRLQDARDFADKNENINKTLSLMKQEEENGKKIRTALDTGDGYYTRQVEEKVQVSYGDKDEYKNVMVDQEVRVTDKTLDKSIDKLEEYRTVVAQTLQQMESLKASGVSNADIEKIFGIDPDALNNQINSMKDYVLTVEDINKKAVEAAGMVDTNPQNAGQMFATAVDEAQRLRDMVESINEAQGMTPEIINQVASSYPDLTSKIHNASAIQDALNQKIQDQVSIQREAYQTMIGDDAEWYNARIQNGNEMQGVFDQFASNFIDINSDAYTFDASNYATLNEAKAGMMQLLAQPISQFLAEFVGGNAAGYEVELRNFENLAQAKAYVLAQLNEKMKVLQNNYNSLLGQLSQAFSEAEPTFGNRIVNQLNLVEGQIADVNTGISRVGAMFDSFSGGIAVSMPSFSTPKIGGSGGGGGGGGGGGDSKDIAKDAAKAAEDAAEDAAEAERKAQEERVQMERDANSQIQDLRDELVSALKEKYQELKEKELEPLEKEIEMKQKELDRLQNGGKDEKERLAALKEELRLWEQNDSAYSKEKIDELKKSVKEAELNLDIKELEDKKETINKKYDDLLSEEKIYAEASKLIQQNKYEEMKNLLTTYGDDFKEISVMLGQSIVDIIKGQLDATKSAYDFLKGSSNSYNGQTATTPSSSSSSSSGSGGGGSSSGGSISTGSRVKLTDAGAQIYYTSTSGGAGTWSGAGVGGSEGLYVVNTSNGRAALSRTNSINGAIGWIEMSKIAKFKVGGDVGNWGSTDGKLAYVHSGERVLTQEQNKVFSDLTYKLLPQLTTMEKSSISNNKTYNNEAVNNSIINFNNNYNVTNKTQFDLTKFKLDIEQIIKNSLAKAGIRTAF